jgi:hypothetical protein
MDLRVKMKMMSEFCRDVNKDSDYAVSTSTQFHSLFLMSKYGGILDQEIIKIREK